MNKKGMEFKSAMFAIVAVSMIVLAFATIIDQQADKYGSSAQSDELDKFNKLSSMSSTAKGYESRLTPDDIEKGADAESSTFKGVYNIITGIFRTFNVVTGKDGMIDDVITQLNIPEGLMIRQGIVTLIFIAIAFSLVAVIFRLSRRSA